MSVVSSQPQRGDKIVEKDGSPTEQLSEYMSDMTNSNNQDNPKKNFIATTNPAITNNVSEGYTRGSEWINNTTDKLYKLTSFTGTDANWSILN